MKKLLFVAPVAGLMLLSCQINSDLGPDGFNSDNSNWGEVTFALDGRNDDNDSPGTRSTTQAAESAINSLQILVFNSSNNLVSYASANASTVSASVPIGVGGHSVYAAVNVSTDLSSCSSPSALTSTVSYLKDNTSAGLQMVGSKSNLTFTRGGDVRIDVTRFASRVEIDEITCAFTAAAFTSQEFKITGIYLINVNGACPFSQTVTTGTWFNQLGYVSGDCNNMISEKFSTPIVLQTSAGAVTAHSTPHYFYCYPNPTSTDTHGGSFSPRYTRLVVETTLGTKTYYYPIDIVGTSNIISPNTAFTVTKLTITGPGVDNPDDKLDQGSINFSLKIKDWATGFSKQVNY